MCFSKLQNIFKSSLMKNIQKLYFKTSECQSSYILNINGGCYIFLTFGYFYFILRKELRNEALKYLYTNLVPYAFL